MNEPTRPMTKKIVEDILTDVEWISPDRASCQCPGAANHTNQSGKRECMVYLNSVPTLHCFHTSCQGAVDKRTKDLRKALAEGSPEEYGSMPSKAPREVTQERERTERYRRRAMKALPRLLKDWHWPHTSIIKESPVEIPPARVDQTKLMLQRFPAEEYIWIGSKFDSGKEEHAKNFKTSAEWLAEEIFNYSYICPATFKPGSIARTNENVLTRPFLVVESDTLTKEEVGAVFMWLNNEVELDLVAVVDTAGKSLHGWFALPPDTDLTELEFVLPALGCDPKLFTISQPVRLPGGLREVKDAAGQLKYKTQNLIYLNQP